MPKVQHHAMPLLIDELTLGTPVSVSDICARLDEEGLQLPRDRERFVDSLADHLRGFGYDIEVSNGLATMRWPTTPPIDRLLPLDPSEADALVALAETIERLGRDAPQVPPRHDLGTLLKLWVPRQIVSFTYGEALQVKGRAAAQLYRGSQAWLVLETEDAFAAYSTEAIWNARDLGSAADRPAPHNIVHIDPPGERPEGKLLFGPQGRGRPTGLVEFRNMQLLSGLMATEGLYGEPGRRTLSLRRAAEALGRSEADIEKAARRLGANPEDGVIMLDSRVAHLASMSDLIDVATALHVRLVIHALDGLASDWTQLTSPPLPAEEVNDLRIRLDDFLPHLELEDPQPSETSAALLAAVVRHEPMKITGRDGTARRLGKAALIRGPMGWQVIGTSGSTSVELPLDAIATVEP